MKSLKDIRELSLQLIVATMHDAEEIQDIDLSSSILWLRKQKFPDVIVKMCQVGKQVETSLITGNPLQVDEKVFPLSEGTVLPAFCFPLFSQIFTLSGRPRYILERAENRQGFILVDSDARVVDDWRVPEIGASAVMLLRQIFLLFSKATDIPVLASEDEEIRDFVSRMSQSYDSQGGIRYTSATSKVFSCARRLLRMLLTPDGQLHPAIQQWVEEPFGAHGPGAVANHEVGREKWDFDISGGRLPSRLYTDCHGTEIGLHEDSYSEPMYSRLCVVPKDFRGHRLICAEPKELQFAQQGLLRIIEFVVESSWITNNHINLRNQSKSYYMSRWLEYGTIDLKEASDRLSLRLLKMLLPEEIYKIVTRFRSNGIILPDGSIIEHPNVAFTMGNALCFPFETLIFWSLCVAEILTRGGIMLPRLSDYDLIKKVHNLRLRVFGDDIIVPVKWVHGVSEILSCAGLVINKNKTCELTLVRESCGSWWYCGVDCRIIKLKYSTILDLQTWTSFQDVIPLLRESGLIKLASVLDEFCNLVYPTREWIIMNGAEALWPEYHLQNDSCKTVWLTRDTFVRYNSHLQRLEYRTPMRCADDTRAFPGPLGYLTWWTQSANRFSNTNAQRVKFEWVALT